jgi:hypothetical protein
VVTSLSIDVLTASMPLRLLRPLSPSHTANPPTSALASRAITNDLPIRTFTGLLATAIYGMVLYTSFATILPSTLATRFDGLHDLSFMYETGFLPICALMLPLGFAACDFIFTPATAARVPAADSKKPFNPVTATLKETFMHNVWDYSARSKIVIQRTAMLVVVCGFNTWLQTFLTIAGVESGGAAIWATIWSTAAAFVGAALWWVGDV